MKTFYYFGPNQRNVSRESFKLWKIGRKVRKVTAKWGRATIVKHKLKEAGKLQTKTWTFSTEIEAKEYEKRRIREKLNGGYSRKARRRA